MAPTDLVELSRLTLDVVSSVGVTNVIVPMVGLVEDFGGAVVVAVMVVVVVVVVVVQ